MNKHKILEQLESGFFGFWVRRYRISFLIILLIILGGAFSLYTIPKESSPDIKFGIISISTVYPGVNPTDMDSLITEKIEKQIKDIEGIKKIESNSQVGVSSIIVELRNDINIRNVLTDIKDEVKKVSLPEDAKEPSIYEIGSDNENIYNLLIYSKVEDLNKYELLQKAQFIKNNIEGSVVGLKSVEIDNFDDYKINILVDKDKLQLLGLSLQTVANAINSFNRNTPIGNYLVGDLNYDFRFDGEFASINEIKNITIRSDKGSKVILEDIASISKKYTDDRVQKLGFYKEAGYNYVALKFNKSKGTNIFQVSSNSKDKIAELFQNSKNLQTTNFLYTLDMSEYIKEDYQELGNTAIQTIVLVFIVILIFVGFLESVVASLLIPLAFLVTFIILNYLGLSLNFLTNFSLVLTLGIAIDTVIVIIEGASEKQHLGYNKKTAILLAIKEFSSPLISGTMTTLAAFLPMMFLPGVMGKFLSYIPTTIFITLVSALILALTVSSALFLMLAREKRAYHKDDKLETILNQEQTEFLASERIGKVEKKHHDQSQREKILENMGNSYYNTLDIIIRSRLLKICVIFIPIILLFLSFSLSSKIGFNLFPATDNGFISGTISATSGTDKKTLTKYLNSLDTTLSKIPEIKAYYSIVGDSNININIELFNKSLRKKASFLDRLLSKEAPINYGTRSSSELEKVITKELSYLESQGLKVQIKGLSNGPPGGKAVGVAIETRNASDFAKLKEVAHDLEKKFSTIPGIRNLGLSSGDSPGQFIFKFDNQKLSQLGLTPNDILNELYINTNGITIGSIKSQYENNDIVVKIQQFENGLSPETIENFTVNTKIGKIRIGDVAKYSFSNAVNSISRKDGKISITIDADLEDGIKSSDIQPKFIKIVNEYNFPDEIVYKAGGENADNQDLIQATIASFILALFLIFSILVLQFNSFRQPAIVLFSVLLALLGVNIGLYITGNPYSMPFGIGFIALTGVVVNDAIILIDRMNRNVLKGIEDYHAIVSAGKSRLQPILVTTLTTVFGILPLALQDAFWAPLGYTMIFGLMAGSSMTLFAIPILYHSIALKKKKRDRK